MAGNDEPDFVISESTISGTHRRDDIFAQDVRSRRRVMHITAQVSIVVMIVLLAGIFVIRAPMQAVKTAHLGTPTSTPHPLSQFIIQSDVSYGTLLMNGKVVPLNITNTNQPLTLTNPHSVITLNALPFLPISCTVDSTTLNSSGNYGRCNVNSTVGNIPVLDMNLSLDDLPPLPRLQFNAYLAQELAQLDAFQATIPANEHYAIGSDAHGVPRVAVSSSPLRAQTLVTLSQSPVSPYASECSDAICPGGIQVEPDETPPQYVNMLLQVNLGWQFYNNAGHLIATYQPANDTPNNVAAADIDIQLVYNASSGWRNLARSDIHGPYFGSPISLQLVQNLCQNNSQLIYTLLQQSTGSNGYNFTGGNAALAGCLLATGPPNDAQSPPDPYADPAKDTNNAWFLVHFGALLTANAKAHVLLPQLPQASAQEITDVQKASEQQAGE